MIKPKGETKEKDEKKKGFTRERIDYSKRLSLLLADTYEESSGMDHFKRTYTYEDLLWLKKHAVRVRGCSEIWAGYLCDHCGKVKHMHTYGCSDRLCPLCSIRKSRAVAAQALQVVDQLVGRPILITLTQRNVGGEDLRDCLRRMSQSWTLVRKVRHVEKNMLAWAKTVEITYNPKRVDFHPHIHIIAYISENRTHLMDKAYWTKMWMEYMDVDQSIDDVREITNEERSVFEISKYVTKANELLTMDSRHRCYAVTTISLAMRGLKLRSYGGQWRLLRRQLKQKEPENMTAEELTEASNALDSRECCEHAMLPVLMAWAGTQYDVVKIGGLNNEQAERGERDAHGRLLRIDDFGSGCVPQVGSVEAGDV